MTAITYPTSLPGPTAAPLQPAERRMLSNLPGPRQSRPMQFDRLAEQQVDFIFTHDELAVFTAWLDGDLVRAGAWFAATWPQLHGGVGVRRFIGEPSYPVHYPNVGWHVSASCEVRGRGELPDDKVDPYYYWVGGPTYVGDTPLEACTRYWNEGLGFGGPAEVDMTGTWGPAEGYEEMINSCRGAPQAPDYPYFVARVPR